MLVASARAVLHARRPPGLVCARALLLQGYAHIRDPGEDFYRRRMFGRIQVGRGVPPVVWSTMRCSPRHGARAQHRPRSP